MLSRVGAGALAVGSLMLGGAIYIAFRSDELRLFGWVEGAGLAGAVAEVRLGVSGWASGAPDWLLYSAADGLWLFALLVGLAVIWWDEAGISRGLRWAATASVLAHEVVQGWWSALGTFAWADVGWYVAAAAAASAAIGMKRETVR